jgi:hypothetical protein
MTARQKNKKNAKSAVITTLLLKYFLMKKNAVERRGSEREEILNKKKMIPSKREGPISLIRSSKKFPTLISNSWGWGWMQVIIRIAVLDFN